MAASGAGLAILMAAAERAPGLISAIVAGHGSPSLCLRHIKRRGAGGLLSRCASRLAKQDLRL